MIGGPSRAVALVLVAWAGLILTATLQGAIPISWGTRWAMPDLIFLIVLYVGLSARGALVASCVLAVVLGYLADLFAGSPKGLHMLAYGLLALASRGASTRLLVRGALLTTLVSFSFALALGGVIVSLRASFEPEVGWGPLRLVPMTALATALMSPLMFRLLARIDRRLLRDARGQRMLA